MVWQVGAHGLGGDHTSYAFSTASILDLAQFMFIGTCVGHRQSKPRSVQGPEGPDTHDCTLWQDPRCGKPRAKAFFVLPHPRGPNLHGWHFLPKCPGTFLGARVVRVQSTSPYVYSEACLGGVPPWFCVFDLACLLHVAGRSVGSGIQCGDVAQ